MHLWTGYQMLFRIRNKVEFFLCQELEWLWNNNCVGFEKLSFIVSCIIPVRTLFLVGKIEWEYCSPSY